MKKKILVLMSTYNGEKYLSQQIDSILNQDCEHEIKLRIRDDGSSDDTVNIIKKFIEKYPGKIEVKQGENVGSNASFFDLIHEAGGFDYYSISDQDDVWLPNKIKVAIEWLEKENQEIPLLYASTSFLVHDDLKPYGTTRKKIREFSIFNTIIQNICPGHTQVYNNELLSLLKKDIDTKLVYVYDSWITNIAMLYGKILFNNESYTYYRQHEQNILGYGNGIIGRLTTSFNHSKSGDGLRYRNQAKYFISLNKSILIDKGIYEQMYSFVCAKSNMLRLKIALKNCFYRQSKLESLAMYLGIMFGYL